jgi:nucleotide-binding universal stress UspA family protein
VLPCRHPSTECLGPSCWPVDGRVAPIIVEVARECQAGVIVMGSHGRGDLAALLLGSVAHKVVHSADRPVLIVR